MRCPKCGFISFDQVEVCSKCGRDVSQVTGELKGTALKTQFSFFLGSVVGGHLAGDTAEETSPPEEIAADPEIFAENEEAVEEEPLELHLDDDEEEAVSADLSLDEEESDSPDLSLEEEAPESAEIDFSGLEQEESGEASVSREDLDLDLEDEDLEDLKLSDNEGEVDADIDLDLESGSEAVVEIPDEQERGVKLNLDVDIEDEPNEVEVALDEIDLSDLVIEDEDESGFAEEIEEPGERVVELEALSLDGMEDQDDSDMFDVSLSNEGEENSENHVEDIDSLSLEDGPAIGELEVESAVREGA